MRTKELRAIWLAVLLSVLLSEGQGRRQGVKMATSSIPPIRLLQKIRRFQRVSYGEYESLLYQLTKIVREDVTSSFVKFLSTAASIMTRRIDSGCDNSNTQDPAWFETCWRTSMEVIDQNPDTMLLVTTAYWSTEARYEHLMLIYTLIVCSSEEMTLFHNNCPSPCAWRPPSSNSDKGSACLNIDNTKSQACYSINNKDIMMQFLAKIRTGLSNYTMNINLNAEFQCECKTGYVFDAKEKLCKSEGATSSRSNFCQGASLLPCKQAGTKACKVNPVSHWVDCICNPGYVGNICEWELDACSMAINYDEVSHRNVSGYEMCEVGMHGMAVELPYAKRSRCISQKRSTRYHCECERPTAEDHQYKLPNCKLFLNSCKNLLCLHGTCVTTYMVKADALCICEKGWEGASCDRREEHWSVWSTCKPVCGIYRHRMRKRQTVSLEALLEGREVLINLTQRESCPEKTGPRCSLIHPEGHKDFAVEIDNIMQVMLALICISTFLLELVKFFKSIGELRSERRQLTRS